MGIEKPDAGTFKEWNENYAEKYNPESYYLQSSFIVRFIENRRIKYIIDLLRPAAKDRVLEVGCGGGHILEKVKQGELYGLDISDFMLKIAKRRLSGTEAKLASGDAGSLPFKDVSYDRIICTEVLEHVLDPEKVIGEIARIARQNCEIILTVPNESLINSLKKLIMKLGLWRLLFSRKYEISKEMNEEWHLHVFDLKRLRELLRDKLVIEKVKYVPFVFLPLRYIIKCRKV